tara:strand:- start:2911 stop:3501 length:591 start_codon:yes stop_codon:yes gene_type:complete
MNNLSKLLDNGTLKIKTIHRGSKPKIKTYNRYFNRKRREKTKRNKLKSKSPQIIIKKQSGGTKSSKTNNDKSIVNRVIDTKDIDTKLDELVNEPDTKEPDTKEPEVKVIENTIDPDQSEDTESKTESKAKPKGKKQTKKRAKKITSKKKKKVKEYDSDTMIERLKQRGILVSGKNKKLLRDIYLYALDDQIQIYHK